jgi:hypothetical protein
MKRQTNQIKSIKDHCSFLILLKWNNLMVKSIDSYIPQILSMSFSSHWSLLQSVFFPSNNIRLITRYEINHTKNDTLWNVNNVSFFFRCIVPKALWYRQFLFYNIPYGNEQMTNINKRVKGLFNCIELLFFCSIFSFD